MLGEFASVIVKLLGPLSTNRLDWQMSNDVPEIAVSGAVGTFIVDPVP
jgi:hypothetical protein